MADALSQSQIDELLNSLGTSDDVLKENDGQPKFKKYDFNTPKKFTRDRLKLLFSTYENFARVFSSYLTSMMRLSCHVEMLDIEEQRYFEFSNALSESDVVGLIEADLNENKNISEVIMLQMSNSVIYALIDRMIGGIGEIDEEDELTDFTDIEISLFENVIVHMLPVMEEAWKNYFDVSFKFDKIETNPRLMQSISSDEIVVIIVMHVEIRGVQGSFNMCIPGSLLEELFKKSEASTVLGKKRGPVEFKREEILESLKDSELEIRAFLGEANILLEDVYSLKPGDVINLKKPKESDITVHIEDELWYKGKLGEKKGNMAVKITGTTVNHS